MNMGMAWRLLMGQRFGAYQLVAWWWVMELGIHAVFPGQASQGQAMAMQWLGLWWVLLFVGPWWLAPLYRYGGMEQWSLRPGGLKPWLYAMLIKQGAVIVVGAGLVLGLLACLEGIAGDAWVRLMGVYLLSVPVLLLLSVLMTVLAASLRGQTLLLGAILMPLALPWLVLGVWVCQWGHDAQPLLGWMGFLCALGLAGLPPLVVWGVRLGW